MSQHKIKIFNCYRHKENELFFSSHDYAEAVEALKFAYRKGLFCYLAEELVTIDEADSYLQFNVSEFNSLGYEYQNQPQGEENDGTTNNTTK